MSKFFTYDQNNSGGRFDVDDKGGIAEAVIIEADSADEANDRAEGLGLYFNGTDDGGPDCPCCGDRWYRVSESDGTDEPKIYGGVGGVVVACVDRASAKDGYRNTAYVHPKVGAFYLVETK